MKPCLFEEFKHGSKPQDHFFKDVREMYNDKNVMWVYNPFLQTYIAKTITPTYK